MQSTTTKLEDVLPAMREVFARGGTITIYPGGESMLPTIKPGSDGVVLAPVPEMLRKGDVILYRRKNGAFVLHRIHSTRENGTFDLLGDHQAHVEKGILREQILALATERIRNGKREPLAKGALGRRARVRRFLFPARSFILRAKGAIQRKCRTKKKK